MVAFINSFVPLSVNRGLRHNKYGKSSSKNFRIASCSLPETTETSVKLSRRALLSGITWTAASLAVAPFVGAEESFTTPSGLQIKVLKKGQGAKIQVGDLVAIRFSGSYNGNMFDNIFETPEPYFYRCGSEVVLKGIDEAVQMMSSHDVYELTIPPQLAFGKKGRRASAGKPSIPPDAFVSYKLEVVSVPGKEDELLEVTGGTLDESP